MRKTRPRHASSGRLARVFSSSVMASSSSAPPPGPSPARRTRSDRCRCRSRLKDSPNHYCGSLQWPERRAAAKISLQSESAPRQIDLDQLGGNVLFEQRDANPLREGGERMIVDFYPGVGLVPADRAPEAATSVFRETC